jgi:hypothetical protein
MARDLTTHSDRLIEDSRSLLRDNQAGGRFRRLVRHQAVHCPWLASARAAVAPSHDEEQVAIQIRLLHHVIRRNGQARRRRRRLEALNLLALQE